LDRTLISSSIHPKQQEHLLYLRVNLDTRLICGHSYSFMELHHHLEMDLFVIHLLVKMEEFVLIHSLHHFVQILLLKEDLLLQID